MSINDVHPEGYYPKHPKVTWDLAQDRWLDSRSGLLLVICQSCDWFLLTEPILAREERVAVEGLVAWAQHSHQRPACRDRQSFPGALDFTWTGPIREAKLKAVWQAARLVYEMARQHGLEGPESLKEAVMAHRKRKGQSLWLRDP